MPRRFSLGWVARTAELHNPAMSTVPSLRNAGALVNENNGVRRHRRDTARQESATWRPGFAPVKGPRMPGRPGSAFAARCSEPLARRLRQKEAPPMLGRYGGGGGRATHGG